MSADGKWMGLADNVFLRLDKLENKAWTLATAGRSVIAKERIWHAALIGPPGVAEDSVECLGFACHALLFASQSNVAGERPPIAPMAIRREFRGKGLLRVALRFCEGGGVTFVIHIRDALQEEQWKDLPRDVGGIDWPTEDVRGLPQMGFQLAAVSNYLSFVR